MHPTHAFERRHDILIDAPPAAILDYVSNPNSWPEWIAASHAIFSPDRPLEVGETFEEQWHTRKGEVRLAWRVTEREEGRRWTARTEAPFLGEIIVTYLCEPAGAMTRYTRILRNPARDKPPTDEMLQRIDAEAREALANIKANVERRPR